MTLASCPPMSMTVRRSGTRSARGAVGINSLISPSRPRSFAAVAGDKGAGHIGTGQAAGLPQLPAPPPAAGARPPVFGGSVGSNASLERRAEVVPPMRYLKRCTWGNCILFCAIGRNTLSRGARYCAPHWSYQFTYIIRVCEICVNYANCQRNNNYLCIVPSRTLNDSSFRIFRTMLRFSLETRHGSMGKPHGALAPCDSTVHWPGRVCPASCSGRPWGRPEGDEERCSPSDVH